MAHFAKIDTNNIVTEVLVIGNQDILVDGVEVESKGVEFCRQLFGADTKWVQTSYNNKFRKQYAGPGYIYDETLDIFIEPKPYNSWFFNATTLNWESPVTMPSIPEGYISIWDEDNQEWYIVLKDNRI
jgi:hypothetical protein